MGVPRLVSADADSGKLPDVVNTYLLENLIPDPVDATPTSALRPSNRFVFLGDSITQSADDNPNQQRGPAWPIIASVTSKGRIVHARNAGVGGNTTQNMIARFATDVTPYSPTVVNLLAGTNDSAVTAFSTWTDQMENLIGLIRGIGAVPIMGTIPPANGSVQRKQAILQQNAWIRNYANRNGVALVDFYTLLSDPANGNYKSAYYSDGIHPNPAGLAAMGKLYSDLIGPTLTAYTPTLTSDDGDSLNLISGGCFTAASGTTLPAGYTDNAGTPANSAISFTTDPDVPGKMITITSAGATAIRQIYRTLYASATSLSSSTAAGDTTLTLPARADYQGVLFIGSGSTYEVVRILSSSGGGPQTETLVTPLRFAHSAGEQVIANAAPGDELLFAARVTTDGGNQMTANLTFSGGTKPAPIQNNTAPFTAGTFSQRVSVPAGNTSIGMGLQVNSGTGVTSWGQVTLYNLTRMAIV